MSLKKWLSGSSYNADKDPILSSSTTPPNAILANNNVSKQDQNNSSSSSVSSHPEKQHDVYIIEENEDEDKDSQAQIFDMNDINPDFPYGDGSDKIFGMENFGNTCYCNSIVQCLYYTKAFRLEILSNPKREQINQPRVRKSSMPGLKPHIAVTANANNNENEHNNNNNSSSYEIKNIRMSFGRRSSSFFGRNKKQSLTDEEVEHANAQVHDQQQQQQQQPNGQHVTVTTIPNIKSNSNNVIVGKVDDVNANVDARKRAALQKGPIINLDHSLVDYNMKNSLYTALKDLFESMIEHESKTGVVSPSHLVETLKKENELFRSTMHQDAHEFLNFLLNEVIDTINNLHHCRKNALHDLFEGLLTNQTKCLTCENVSSRDETFLDLSIDLTDNETLETCLKQFSASEMLNGSNKFYCDNCHSLQEAEKKMGLRKLPKILALHLKRFKYSEEQQRNVKLFQKIKYPLYFKLESDIPAEKKEDGLKFYQLYGVVVHIGGGPHHGHYVALVKTIQHGWLLFDDETVEKIDEKFVLRFTGDSPDLATAYVLFYQEISEEKYEQVINKPVEEDVKVSEKDEIQEKVIRVNSNNNSISSSQPSTISSDTNKPIRPPPVSVVEPQDKNRLRTPSLSSIARLKSKSSQNTVTTTSTPASSISAPQVPLAKNVNDANTLDTPTPTPSNPQPITPTNNNPQSTSTSSSFWRKKEKESKVGSVEDKEKEKKKNRMSMSFGFKKNNN
ncbi:hypothetical protein WICANDRAFT_97047 [Wickerhamomyces anomalus NRRL Y-366-8]|uniref:Ubiquitin carboxyl-terminal hydrolase n=1 Tax=Wickerhamomyces anomalus (strain ATCC 58044 / CBS 1984 / NCYC 433 / NRRL Y-366-8) TaxID=683960 RepID=A0A1E3NWZ1_WICAA|nr:uncharacterized protein WICANDRAFT_97047 [Wickerhamomyces anomalus NRRL Y-366-8]ODQ57656.1 hypothetical protein WICANDRAFT_97047 [Wickerhamomyces anomalus NRRL Y-366-8]